MPEISIFHRTAREFVGRGTPIFPCRSKLKKPMSHRGFLDATTDLATIDKWWAAELNANPAFSPHTIGQCVIDADGEEGLATYEELRKVHNLEDTYTVRTPRGGRHFYFLGELPGSQWTPTGKRVLGPHIDTRGVGSYVLCPGSYVDDGKAKGWYKVENDIEPAFIPPSIVELLKPIGAVTSVEGERDTPGAIEQAKTFLKTKVSTGAVAVQQQGGNALCYSIASNLVRDLGLTPDTATDLMLEHWYLHCKPNDKPEFVWRLCHNADRYGQNTPGVFASQMGSERPAFQAALDKLALDNPTPSEARPRDNPFYFEDDAEQDLGVDPAWVIDGLIPDQNTVLILGAKGEFKTFIAAEIGLSIAANVKTFGVLPTRSAPVFYGTHEGRHTLKKARKNAWKKARGLPPSAVKKLPFYTAPAPRIIFEDHVKLFHQAIKDRMVQTGIKQLGGIILDTVAKCMVGLDENKAMDAGKFVAFCDELKDTFRCPVIALHHLDKTRNPTGRGSSALPAGFDTVIRVTRHEKTLSVKVEVDFHKDAEEPPPYHFQGRVIDGQLVFDLVDEKAFRSAVEAGEMITPSKITVVLKALGAYDDTDIDVSSGVLANRLLPMTSEPQESREKKIDETVKILDRRAKHARDLKGFTRILQGALRWTLPASDRQRPTSP